jgi:hypothetical protein
MIKFEMHEHLADEVLDSLRDAKINVDDWDYVLFIEQEYEHQFVILDEGLEPRSYEVQGLLHGSCGNCWYYVMDFMGRTGIIGIAYHS